MSVELDLLVLAYVEMSKVTDKRNGFPDDSQCDMYWFIMRRFFSREQTANPAVRFL